MTDAQENMDREQAFELAKAMIRGECTTFGDELPVAYAFVSAEVEVARLREVIEQAIRELVAEHYPDPELSGRGGCATCWPTDGRWPCTSRLIADDLHRALSDSPDPSRNSTLVPVSGVDSAQRDED